MAIGLRASRSGRADIAAGARLVVDDDGLVPAFAQLLADDARQHIGPAARGEGDDDEDVPIRQALSLCQARGGSRHRQGGEQAPARQYHHMFPPNSFLRGCVGAQSPVCFQCPLGKENGVLGPADKGTEGRRCGLRGAGQPPESLLWVEPVSKRDQAAPWSNLISCKPR